MRRSLLLCLVLLALGTAGWYGTLHWLPVDKAPAVGIAPPHTVEPPLDPSADIRVNLTQSPRAEIRIAVDGPYELRALYDSRVLGSGKSMPATSVRATSTRWQVGAEQYDVDVLELVPANPPAIWVGEHQYRGSVRFHRDAKGRVTCINVLPLEEYLASVIDSEMPLTFGDAARHAQAIVARTYAVYQMQRVPAAATFDVYASTRSQKYLGFQYRTREGRRLAGESADSRRIARETSGIVCTHHGRVFCTYYCAVCGGRTTQGGTVFADAVPLLASVPCPWCADAPLCRWQAELSRADVSRGVQKLVAPRDRGFGPLVSIRAAPDAAASDAEAFQVSDGRRSHRLLAADLRSTLPTSQLYSPHFSIRENRDRFIFEGRGHGHGVGLCQWGARGMARAGKSAAEIIDHYYPGVELTRLHPREPAPAAASLVRVPAIE